MRALLISVGTRGDVEPFLYIAQLLRNNGHEVMMALPEQLSYLPNSENIEHFPLNKAFLELIESSDGKLFVGRGASFLNRAKILIKLIKKGLLVNRILVEEQEKVIDEFQPGIILFHAKASLAYLWSIRNPGKAVLISPVPCIIHKSSEYPHLGFGKPRGAFWNRLTYSFANFGLIQNLLSTTKAYRRKYNISKVQVRKHLLSQKIIYTISPTLFPEYRSLPEHAKVLGYHNRASSSSWEPSSELISFLKANEKIVFV